MFEHSLRLLHDYHHRGALAYLGPYKISKDALKGEKIPMREANCARIVNSPIPLALLKTGQTISIVVYKGMSALQAKWTHDYFEHKRLTKKSVPLGGTSFDINIEKVEREPSYAERLYFDGRSINHVIKIKGVII